jgi:hypothetical protein
MVVTGPVARVELTHIVLEHQSPLTSLADHRFTPNGKTGPLI